MRTLLVNCGLFLIIIYLSACGTPLKIRESTDDDCLAFDTQKWGEYATMIELIELIDIKENSVIWSVQPLPGKFARISGLNLCKGLNSRRPLIYGDKDALEFIVHSGADSFNLISGKYYQLTVVSPEHRKPGRVIFSFPD